jgi:hypothetical protein
METNNKNIHFHQRLDSIMQFSEQTKDKAQELPKMMQMNVQALKENYEMHLENLY